MTEPTQDPLDASDKVEKRTIGGEIRYYLKDIAAHWPTVVEQLRRDAMIGGIV